MGPYKYRSLYLYSCRSFRQAPLMELCPALESLGPYELAAGP